MKIKKSATAKHEATLSPFIREFVATATSIPIPELVPYLSTFPRQWPFPRGDLYHWIPLLNRFDTILEEQVIKYKFKDGPQTIPWELKDKDLVIGILDFTRLLVENCGNRSLYASSSEQHVGELLNSTDVDILLSALGLGWRLAQRYHTSRTRGGSSATQATLLASHYSINLNKVVTLASPFLKSISVSSTSTRGGSSKTVLPVYATDLGRIARGENPVDSTSPGSVKGKDKAEESKEGSWEEWGGAWISYYVNPKTQAAPASGHFAPKEIPTTPTPHRRSSLQHPHPHHHHHHHGPHTSGSASRNRVSDDLAAEVPELVTGGLQTLEVPLSRIKESPNLEEIVKSTLPDLPTDSHYDFLHRLRVAAALSGDIETRRKILAVRILALTNLAYVYNEQQFAMKILILDQDEPRRLQLAYQLAELVQGGDRPGKGGEVPRWLQALALGGLEALARHKSKTADVCAALSVNVNHGVLLYLMRKAVVELSVEGDETDSEADEWREALFSLVCYLPTTSHTGSLLVSAGLIPVLVDLVNLRAKKAFRLIPKALSLLDQLLYTVQTAFQTFANAKGLEAVVDLASYETQKGLEEVEQGKGIPDMYRTEQTDYKISHQRQQTLKMVTKFMQHMMAQSGAGVDRLLRNLVDNPKLLEAIRVVIGQGPIWGSHIWSTVVGMISAFIHNEPTSYAVIHEAHITHTFLEAITGRKGLAEDEVRRKDQEEAKKQREQEEVRRRRELEELEERGAASITTGPSSEQSTVVVPPEVRTADAATATEESWEEPAAPSEFLSGASHIMPSQDAIGSIPTALGAICLNPLGLDLIQHSGALDAFFEIFESPAHIKILIDGELDNLLGTQFDELVRHHPNLRESIMKSTLRMLDRVLEIGKKYAVEYGMGAKVWLDDGKGGLVVSGGRKALVGSTAEEPESKPAGLSREAKGNDDGDVEMSDADTVTIAIGETHPDGAPVGEVVTVSEICTLADLPHEEAGVDPKIPPITDYIDVAARYLEGFITNNTQTRELLQRGGLDKLLAFYSLPSLPYDFAASQASHTICRAMHLFCESNLVDTLKTLFTIAQTAVDKLQPFLDHNRKEPFFAALTNPSSKAAALVSTRLHGGAPSDDEQAMAVEIDDSVADAERQGVENIKANGTTLIKNLVTVHALSFLFQDLYHQSMFNARQSVQVFLQTAQDSGKEDLILKLGALQRQCVWEELQLQKAIPSDWDEVTKSKDSAMGAAAAIEEGASGSGDKAEASQSPEQKKEAQKAVIEKDGNTSWFRNVKTCVINRRHNDSYHKYLAFKLVDSIGSSMYKHLTWERIDKYGYWIVMLTATMSLLLEGASPDYFNTPKNTPPDRQPFVITTTLVTFKQMGGLEVIKKILRTFWAELQHLPASEDTEVPSNDDQQRMAHAYGGIRIILSLFSYLVSDRSVQHASQSEALHNRLFSEYSRPDYFNTNQLLVELRAAILPVVHEMWESSTMEKKASSAIVKSVIEILGIILKGDHENAAFTRKELEKRPGLNNTLSWRAMMPRDELVRQLTEMGFGREAALNALLRCSDNVDNAANWLSSHGDGDQSVPPPRLPHGPMDEDEDDDEDDDDGTDVDVDLVSGQPVPAQVSQSTGEAASDSSMAPPPPPLVSSGPEDDATMTIEDSGTPPSAITPAAATSSVREKGKAKETEPEKAVEKVVTIEDLEELRAKVRESLVGRSLDVLQVQGEITFELAELIRSAFDGLPSDTRKDVVATMVQSLLSLQMEEDFRPQAKTIASIAHLLGLLLQNQRFYEAAVEDLNEQLGVLAGFIKIYPGERAPWIANILLVVEKLLSENAQPQKIKFTPGQSENEPPVVENDGIKVSEEDQYSIFDAIVSIIPDIDKEDGVLALAVTRVLVLLTRRNDLAAKMVQNEHLRKLFHMYRRQAGNNVDRLQPAILLLLRHIVEDDDTLRAVMKAEIRAQFSARPSRQMDTNTFAKNCAHLILRNPDIFVECTAELCKLNRYDSHLRNQGLALKEAEKPKSEEPAAGKTDQEPKESQGESSGVPSKKPEEKVEEGKDASEAEKPKTSLEIRPPGVEKPDGVIHFLLMELFAIKDVKDFTPPPKVEAPKAEPTVTEGGDVQMAEAAAETDVATETDVAKQSTQAAKTDKPEFKAENYPYFFYRCFILMTLMELLCCYNRCKVEFINFNRKADPREPITPSKPRSAIFNYLLHDLISQQSLTGPATDDIEQKTKDKLSQWAIHVFVSLCTQSGEVAVTEDEPDLLFVRKFFFETALKAFKDACASTEPLDIKYARMASLGDLFYKVLSVRPPCVSAAVSSTEKPEQGLAKIMLEKNYIAALTNALADVDLNYPNSRKVIKSMLKPLKLLSKTAVDLSETSGLSTPGATDEDDISVASSISSIDDMREETPDLYRNSTLGLFEGGEMGDDETSSYDEEEDDEEIYDEDMEFEDELEDGGSELSEEDEEEGADNMDVSICNSHRRHGMSLIRYDSQVEIVVQDEHEEGSDSDEDEDDMSDDMDDDGAEVEIIDELGHHHHHHDEYESGGEDDWQSDGSDEDHADEGEEDDILTGEGMDGGVESIMRALGDEGPDILDDPEEDGFLEEEGDEEEDMEGEEDDDELDEEEGMMGAEDYDDDDEGASGIPWGFAEGDDAPIVTRPRGVGGWFTFSGSREPPVFSSTPLSPDMLVRMLTFPPVTRPGRSRHYMGASGERGANTNREQNPLLQQADNEPAPPRHTSHRHEFMGDWAQAFGGMHPDSGPVTMISTLMNLMNRGGVVPNGAFQIQATIPHHRFPHGMQREIQSMFGNFRPSNEPIRHHHREDPNQVGRFEPSSTPARWLEEARLLFGSRVEESAQRVVNTILHRLVPLAIEEEKILKAKEEEKRKEKQRLEEERKQKEEEERIAREKAEAEEKARKEAEEKEAAERAKAEEEARAAEAAANAPEGQQPEAEQPVADLMEGVEATSTAEPAQPGPSAQPLERATVMIRGREMDITGMGIDPEFLEAIPEDMREEALTQHIRERRAAAASSDEPSEISREFLDALPDDIREELLAQEAADRRRREQETARAQGGGGAVDIDLATFLATLEPGLRQTVLMEQDEEALAQLPHAIVEEVNALRGDRGFHSHFVEHPRRGVPVVHLRHPEEPKTKKPTRKGTVQLLDKAGVATLLRLMFIPQVGSTRATLHEILLNICENRQNRAEVVNLLLSILQDGSADMVSVERSFAQLSVRAKQPAIHLLKTPVKPGTLQRASTMPTGPVVFTQTSGEVSPLMVAQQCLHALTFLVNYNEHIPSYFLNEHDISTGLKKPKNHKGKGKVVDNKANKYALNTLLSLLDRPLITESSSVMDQLSVLLSEITRPLTILLKKDKKKTEDEKPKEEQPAAITEAETSTTAEPAAVPAASTDGASMEQPKQEGKEDSKDESKHEDKKKPRNLVPPVVPEHNLRLVVNILTAHECSSKTFRETLATMQNLSGIPGSKEIFGAELIRQAQGLGSIIFGHLDELLQQVKNAENGTEVQGMALANFSPASSEQAKLLRVLTALDYLFDPKRSAAKDKSDEKKEGEPTTEESGDVLAKLYESLTFTPLWSKLSDCLSAIHARSDMLHVATILLPLIEALMVVCKNCSLEENATVPESSSMRQLFFKFTEDHRKILNQMVRNNPKLMSGSFALLVKNPKVLDFDNKRNYFNRRLHTRQGVRDPHPTLQLAVRRDQVFLDSYKSMYYKTGDEIKYAKLSIRFHGEEGVDAGGVTREWFQVMSRQMFNPDYALFIPVASDRTTFHPNSSSGVNPEHLSFFKFIGRIIGKALYEGRVLDCHFSRAVYKRILGKSVSLKDMETLDLEYYKSLVWMLENNIDDVITETFSVEIDEFGARRIIDLIPDGRNIPVTNENKHDYVRRMVDHRLLHSVSEQINHFLIGFHDIVPADLISIFNEQELELLISGMPEIDLDDWRNNTEYHNYSASSSQIQWFWRAVRSFDKEERAKLLQFVTGTSKVPLNGFKELEGMNGFSKFNIHRDYGNKDRLPSSHTCFNQLDLPEYESYETLRQRLLTAITQGADI
ncbi:DNA binding protein [Sphaerosporella brunnea]|uniref:HECT-type E3 ubiquitin transferase n=1 Tax=Sphaerosporella brunnea TaxID=1250544 RepID=A0A5J5F5Z6_9PEZI|nr:DNA binding protein [Sphaerosporella brunnea]